MSLRTRFNIVFIIIFLVGLSVSALIGRHLLQQSARDEIVREALLMMESAVSVRSYTVDEIKPLLDPLNAESFHPQTVPAFAATETFNRLKEKYPEYSYREAVTNPTNPRDETEWWEAKIVNTFKGSPALSEIVGERSFHGKPFLYVARPIKIKKPACLACHSDPSIAPPSLIGHYGIRGGFNWKLNEIVGTQLVSVPMSLPVSKANKLFGIFIAIYTTIFSILMIALNIMVSRMVVRPVVEMSIAAERISKGDFSVEEFGEGSGNEISTLQASFNRMRRSLEHALRMQDKLLEQMKKSGN